MDMKLEAFRELARSTAITVFETLPLTTGL